MKNYIENFKIEFQPKLTSKEKELFRNLLNLKKDNHNTTIITTSNEVCKILKTSTDELETHLKKLLKKSFSIYESNNSLYSNLFNYIRVENSNVHFSFTKKIFMELDETQNFLGIDLTPFLYFNEKFTGNFYINLLNKVKRETTIYEYSLPLLKELLMVEKNYERFYDFERFVLKKLVKDINTNTPLNIDYEKIRFSDKKGSKVVAIILDVKGENPYLNNSFVDQMLSLFKEDIEDTREIKEILINLELKKTFDEVLEVVKFTLKYSKKENLEKNLINALNKLASDDKLIHLETFKYSNIFSIQSKIIKQLKGMYPEHILYDSFFSHGLLKELYKFKKKKNFNFMIKDLEIKMLLNKNDDIKLEFWKRS